MSFGKLYTADKNPRSVAIRAVAKANKLDLDIVTEDPAKGVSTEYLNINKLGKIPTFIGADGYKLTEAIAIAIYVTSQNEKTTLLGKTKQDYATILKWMSFFNSEVLPNVGGWYRQLNGRDPYNKKNLEDFTKNAEKVLSIVEEHLLHNTYLAGERVTLADLFSAGLVSRGFEFIFDKQWRSSHPNITRWYETVYHHPTYAAVVGELSFIEEAIKYTPPKKVEQPKAPKAAAAPKPKAKPEEDEEDEPKEEPKAKHPIELLPKPTIPLDEWKRQYSNNDTPDALKWFWDNFNPEEYSLWRVDYKYNDELTQIFMTSNLIGGFFARLEGSRKYIFGCASVYGEPNASVIQGAFVIRGQEALPAFDVAPDYESYEFTKLDHTKAEDMAFVDLQWTWEKPVTVAGKEYPWKDGKVFK